MKNRNPNIAILTVLLFILFISCKKITNAEKTEEVIIETVTENNFKDNQKEIKSLNFDNEIYNLAFTGNNFKEYLREGETFENYKKMIAIYEFSDISIENYVNNLVEVHKSKFPDEYRNLLIKKDSSEIPDDAVVLLSFPAVNKDIPEEFDFYYIKKKNNELIVYLLVLRDKKDKADIIKNKDEVIKKITAINLTER